MADESVDAIYNLDFETAQKRIDAMLEKSPNYPIGLFGRTMIEWGRFTYEFEKSHPEQAIIFEETIEASLSGIKEWLKENEADSYAYMALGGTYGVKAMFELGKRNYVNAYFIAKKGLKNMNKASKLDPDNTDTYLGEALYQYYAGTLPSVIKVLAKLLVSGNAEKGIEYLNMIQEKGRFGASVAKLMLVEIFIENPKYYDPSKAAKLINEVKAKYDKNPLFDFVAIIAAYENGQYDKVIREARVFLSKIGKERLYKDIYTARSYTAVGTSYMAKKDYEKAAEVFEQSIKTAEGKEMSRWQLYNELRLAETYDLLGEREKAVALYKKVNKTKEAWGIDALARQYIRAPYIENIDLGRMSPP
jgi:tetratricopeptide (TPR) repeat protein